jgi:hypothetical protein
MSRSFKNLTIYERWSLLFTGLIALTTVIYAIFAYGQWRELSETNRSNSEQLISIQKATIIFNGISGIPFSRHTSGNKIDKGGVQLSPNWNNVGNTQTKNLRFYFAPIVKADHEVLDPPNFKRTTIVQSIQTDAQSIQAILGPKSSASSMGQTLTRDEIQKMLDSKLFVILWGEATYNDIFQGTKPHVIQFCSRIINILTQGGLDASLKSGTVVFQFVNCFSHNCMDEECNK